MNIQTEVTIHPFVASQLTELKFQFVEMAYKRIAFIEKELDFTTTPAHIRLLYLKELYAIFEELNAMNLKKPPIESSESEIDSDVPEIDSVNVESQNKVFKDLKLTVSFIRNILSHFPLFNTWDDIWISQDFSIEMGGKEWGKIYKFIIHDEDRKPIGFKLTLKDKTENIFNIMYPQNSLPSDKIYLKEIINEKDGAFAVIQIMHLIF